MLIDMPSAKSELKRCLSATGRRKLSLKEKNAQ
jgi:hypothetical protein